MTGIFRLVNRSGCIELVLKAPALTGAQWCGLLAVLDASLNEPVDEEMGEGDARYQRYIDDQHAPRTPASSISGVHCFSIGLCEVLKAKHSAHTLAEGVRGSAISSQNFTRQSQEGSKAVKTHILSTPEMGSRLYGKQRRERKAASGPRGASSSSRESTL